MRIWFKAILITASIAAVILFFETYLFIDKHREEHVHQPIELKNNPSPEADSIKLQKRNLLLPTK